MNEAEERAKFEAWYDITLPFRTDAVRELCSIAWQARAALAPTVPTEPKQKPEWDQHAHAACDLNALVSMLGGENGPSIRLRAYIAERKPTVPTEPVAWAISYDGKTPHSLWHDGDGALLDLEVKRLGGSACKLALYAAPQRKPLLADEVDKIADSMAGHDRYTFTAAIEAAHGITGESA